MVPSRPTAAAGRKAWRATCLPSSGALHVFPSSVERASRRSLESGAWMSFQATSTAPSGSTAVEMIGSERIGAPESGSSGSVLLVEPTLTGADQVLPSSDDRIAIRLKGTV